MIILQKSALTLVEELKKIETPPPPLGPFLCKKKKASYITLCIFLKGMFLTNSLKKKNLCTDNIHFCTLGPLVWKRVGLPYP